MAYSLPRSASAALVLTAAAAALVLTGCSAGESSGPDASGDGVSSEAAALLPSDVAESGTLRVAMSVGFQPFEYFEDDGTTITGVDFELAQALASQLGLELEAINTPFDGIIPGLAADRYDVIMSGLTDKPERQEQVTFVDYFKGGNGFLVLKGNPLDLEDFTSLCGLPVATLTGTTPVENLEEGSQACVDAGEPAIDVTLFSDGAQANLALKTDRVDVVVMDTAAGGFMASESGDAFEMLPTYAASYFGAAVEKDSELAQALQVAFRELQESGEYEDILSKYGQDTGVVDDFLINGTDK